MANARRKRGKGKPNKPPVEKAVNPTVSNFMRPTEYREAQNDFQSALAAVKVIPPIDTLYRAKKLTERQYKGLARYADVANASERSEIRSNIDFSVRGDGEGLPHFGVRMTLELDRMDRALKHLREIAHAVCVKEQSVSQYAMDKGGSVMRERQTTGRKFVRWYEPKRMQLMIAMIEIQSAGDVLAKELGY